MKRSFIFLIFIFILSTLVFSDGVNDNVYNFKINSYPSQTSDGYLIYYNVEVKWSIIDDEKFNNNLADKEIAQLILESSTQTNLIIITKKYTIDKIKDFLAEKGNNNKESKEQGNFIYELEEMILEEIDYGIGIEIVDLKFEEQLEE